MLRVMLCLISAAAVSGIKYDGLRVTFGWSSALADRKYFFIIPMTIQAVEVEGWQRTERPKGPMKELRMYCPPGRIVCPLYDIAGFIAGLQIAVPEEAIDASLRPEKQFVKWSAAATDGEPARDFWTATQFFVSPGTFVLIGNDSLRIGAGPTEQNGATLQDGGVWVSTKGNKSVLMKIPLRETDLKGALFVKQNCIPNMGTHYYYNFTKLNDCQNLSPWFVMTNKGEVLGVGFQTFGRRPQSNPNERQWFEEVPKGGQVALLAMPSAADCVLKLAENFDLLSIHIYYINDPWNIMCRTGDSVDPAPLLDRLALSGHRYATNIGDQIEKLISG